MIINYVLFYGCRLIYLVIVNILVNFSQAVSKISGNTALEKKWMNRDEAST